MQQEHTLIQKKSMLDPSVRLEGDYEQHKNKANTTAGKETMLRRICEISPAICRNADFKGK